MNRSMHGAAEKGQEVLENLKDDASQIAADVAKLGHTLQGLAANSMENAQRKVSKLYESGQAKMEGVEKKISARIKERPIQSLIIAAGVGFLLGWMQRKRS